MRVLKSCHQQLIEWHFQHFLIDLVRVHKHISVHLHLDSQNRNLVSSYFQLVWLAVKTEAVDWLTFLRIFCLLSSSNESELNVRIKVTAQVLEWQLELLDSLNLFDCQRDQLRIGRFVVQLLHALYSWVVKVPQKQNLDFSLNTHLFGQSFLRLVGHMLFNGLGGRVSVMRHLDVNEAHNSSLESVLGCFHNNNEFLLSL